MRKALIGAGIGLAAALFALLLGRLPFIDVVELKTYDWRMRATAGSARASDDIVLVTIDEESIRGLEPLVGRWPWPRLVHASVLNYLARAQPRVVLYDVLFTEHDRTKFFVAGRGMERREVGRRVGDVCAPRAAGASRRCGTRSARGQRVPGADLRPCRA